MKKIVLVLAGILCSVVAVQAAKVTFLASGTQTHWGEMTAVTANGQSLLSGGEVADGTQVTFNAPQVVGYYVDWYVNDVKDETALTFSMTLAANADVKVEARYTERPSSSYSMAHRS